MLLVVILMGLCIGSFLNVCIYRIAREESISYPPSHCTSCGYNLKTKDLVPVLSYLFLKGKCRSCGEKISLKYPIIEITNCILYLLLFIKYGATIEFVKYCIFTSLLIVIGMIDYETKFVYRSTIIFGGISGIIFIALEYFLYGTSVMSNFIGALIGFATIFFIVLITRGMGEGDIEIAAICGLYLGWQGAILNIVLAFVIGGVVGIYMLIRKKSGRKAEMAFGPFLVCGAFITIFYGTQLIQSYINYAKI